QVEMRAVRAQDRAARQIHAARLNGPNLRLFAHLHRGLWAVMRRREARPETAVPPGPARGAAIKASVAPPASPSCHTPAVVRSAPAEGSTHEQLYARHPSCHYNP